MATAPVTPTAVTLTPKGWDAGILIIFKDQASANRCASVVETDSDAAAKVEGPVYELPMIRTGSKEQLPNAAFETDFVRVLTGRRLLQLRDVTHHEDVSGAYWKATALWTFDAAPTAAVVEEA
jgi:anti-sigma-K factor RskA